MTAALTKSEVETYLSTVDLRGPLEGALNAAIGAQAKVPIEFFAAHFAAGGKAAGPSTALTKKDVETYLGSVDVRGPLEAALNAAVSFQTKEPMEFFTKHFAKLAPPAQSGSAAPAAAPTGPHLVDVASLTQIAKDYLGLKEQPAKPTYRTGLVQIYVRSAPYGGSDKSSNGHRYDMIPFANGMINAGISCQPIHYVHEEHDTFFEVVKNFDALIVRCNPGQIKADGGSQEKFDDSMRAIKKSGIQVWPSPDVMEFMGAKDALTKIAHLNIGLEDTFSYYTEEAFTAGFKKTMAFQPRVIKQNRGSSGEGIWIIKLKEGNYCPNFGDRVCEDGEVLSLMEANDNHAEEHTVAEFIEFCVNGRTDKSGEWTSKGVGKYLEGGKEAGGMLVDQRFCPRIVEGELRYNCVGPELVGIIHKKPKEGGISAVGGTGSIYTFYGPDEPTFKNLTDNFLKKDLNFVMPSLGLGDEPIPLWWTTDFILASPEGTPAEQEKWIVGEFNCSCVGISKCLPAYCKDDTPNANWNDIPAEDKAEAMIYGDKMGKVALSILANACGGTALIDVSPLTQIAKDYLGLKEQPANPKFRTALVQIYVRSAPYGGSDKSSNGHRYDMIPFANGMINAGISCQPIHYVHEEHDTFFEVVKNFDALIVRCNPGQIKADGGSQEKFDDSMRAIKKSGIQVWPSPDVMEFMGAKDALTKIAHLNIGLEDTFSYYEEEAFTAGFKKTMAFQPRVIKQNRGSSGEGIWIIKLKEGNYCPNFGDRVCEDGEVLSLMEANDNHAEEHTVAEFIEFCVNGRTDKSGEWTSKGVGKYLEGGKEAGGMLVDQRFCPRIVEGELRYNCVGPELVGIIHKKPKEGGISAVGGTGSIYTFYGPDEPKFKNLTDNFLKKDLNFVMPSLGLGDEPIPLWWTTDFILASPEGTPAEQEKWIVGEFNCSCVGISKCLPAYCKDDTPNANWNDIPAEDKAEAMIYGDKMGKVALSILANACGGTALIDVSPLTQIAKDYLGLKEQPANPKFRTALVQIYVRSAPYGGSDKSSNGHRYDMIPFANGMINAGISCQPIHYVHEEHDTFFEVVKNFDALIVRCNPGQIKADGGSQEKFDDSMRAIKKSGIQVWPSPDVMEFMGAKDALTKIAHLNIGLVDTFSYYTEEAFTAGFKKTMAFQPRVIKQNRGSSGEGIWIIKLKEGNYCPNFGDRVCEDGEVLSLMEANDNHAEEHTVAEFIEFCVNGRTDKSGEWTSKGVGKYLEGGKEAGGMLVDQRFCPRIVEGELRYNCVGPELVGIIHKKPKEGGISAVGGTGSIYTFYGPDEPKFQNLTDNFLKKDINHVMPSLGLSDEPIPLWWTTDFILASPEGTPAAEEKWIVGEFNCSCVGISKCLPAYCKDDTPNANWNDIPAEDKAEAMIYGDKMGVVGLDILTKAKWAWESSTLVDVSGITRVAKDDLGLFKQPASPRFKTALVQIYVRGAPYGGSDKSSNGHRYDMVPFANGMINAGLSCQPIHYVHEEHDTFFEVVKNFDALIVRCNPGQIKADGGSQEKFDDSMRAIKKSGIQVWPSPDVMEFMGAKDALTKIAHLNIGLVDTFSYYTEEAFTAGFKKTMAFQPRVIKQNRGSSGEGIWIIKLKEGNYCPNFGDRVCEDGEVLSLMEANDNHAEEHTVAEFIEFCVNGRTDKSGEWTSKGVGKYLEGGKEAGGMLVDQRFCPRIVEGELRYNCVGPELVGIIHKKPKEGGISAVGGTGSIYTFYGPDEPKFQNLTDNFLKKDINHVMPSLGLSDEPIPLWWTTDFILASPEGTPAAEEKWIVGEFNCSCVGISKCLPAYCKDDTPNANWNDIPLADKKEAMIYGNKMGQVANIILSTVKDPLVNTISLTKVATSNLGLLPQPANPKFKTALVQIYVRGAPYGGSDKSSNGHRYDMVPFANGMINAGISCQPIHYVHEEHDTFFEVVKNFDALIVRCNPGQIKADGGSQEKFDDSMRAIKKSGIQVWPSPDVMEFMGAKDALTKIAHLNIGLEDTFSYYEEEAFTAGFKKTMAFQPRVIKQNRGSSGEGIWIIKLKEGNYCPNFGDRVCEDGEVLSLMEANDNHAEEHTVAEFIEFCVNGRTDKSGEWTSKGVGKYLEGGKEAGGMLVDQRFCPRIVEGELRYNCVGPELVGIIHKKPKEGGISAVGGTGSIYTFYGPDEPKFQNLTDNFLKKDINHVMPSLGLSDEPIPLWWTTDFILASPEGTPAAEEKWIVGEFNCSCVGISKCLPAYCKDDTPNANWNDIPAEDKAEAMIYGDKMGQVATDILNEAKWAWESSTLVDVSGITRVAKDDLGLLKQPLIPKFKTALVQIYVRGAPYGGSDKSSNGHRYDMIPFANGMINAGLSCQPIHYVHEEHDTFFEVVKNFDALIVRCNPGQIKADGGSQEKFDDSMRAIKKSGIQVWPSPDVMEFMGAKDALTKIAHLNIGLEDTFSYYEEEAFTAGFKKTMAFQPRVIKQNRGSSGEGIWIIKLKEGNYCPNFGDRVCEDGEVLSLMEANDNHAEEHTVAEFIEFCVNGRTDKSGEWTSKGVGKYLEGGKEAGGMLVDQRFCPRIVEGELRYNCVGPELVGIIHKKPKEGGISAVGGTGSIYTFYGPNEPKFQNLTDNFLKKDINHVMPSLGLSDEPIPLWWTTDFILASPEGTPAAEEKWIVGEFNCSCVGISKCLPAYCKDDTPNANWNDISIVDKAEAMIYGNKMGTVALDILSKAKSA